MNMLALGFGNFGGPDLFIILLIVLVLFGAKKLPELARSLGQSMNEFRKAREEFDRELHTAGNEVKSQPQPYQPAQNVQPAQPAGQANQSQPQVAAGNEQRPQGEDRRERKEFTPSDREVRRRFFVSGGGGGVSAHRCASGFSGESGLSGCSLRLVF